MTDATDPEALLTPREVARRFRVDPKTVTRWANYGRITAFRTPGGHRRFRAGDIEAFLNGSQTRSGEAEEYARGDANPQP